MARRRYVSTEISTDPRVCTLAEEYGVFAALLYTWMIPHADDAGALSDDARKLRMLVIPGLPQTTADVTAAIYGMIDLGLLEHDGEAHQLRFPSAAFNRYQSYINKERRTSAQNTAEQRTSAQNTTSSSFSSPVKSSFSSNDSVVEAASSEPQNGADAPSPLRCAALSPEQKSRADSFSQTLTGINGFQPTAAFLAKVITKYEALDLEESALAIAGYAKKRPKWLNDAAILNWLRKDLERLDTPQERTPRNGTDHGPMKQRAPTHAPISDEAREYVRSLGSGAPS